MIDKVFDVMDGILKEFGKWVDSWYVIYFIIGLILLFLFLLFKRGVFPI